MRLRWLVLLFVLILLLGGWWLASRWQGRALYEVRQAVQAVEAGPEVAVDLSLSGVDLVQGEQGEQLWKLHAVKAWFDQQQGVIQVAQPELTYYTQPGTSEIFVRSERGIVDQKSRVARLWEDVVVTRDSGETRSDLLIYNGTAHSLTMPGDVEFFGVNMNGTARHVTWSLRENTMNAEADVVVHLRLRPASASHRTGDTGK